MESDTTESFREKMPGMVGDSFPSSLIDSVDRLVKLRHPRLKERNGNAKREGQQSIDDKSRGFTGSALPDKDPNAESIDKALRMLEALETKIQESTFQKKETPVAAGVEVLNYSKEDDQAANKDATTTMIRTR